ncbi:hypothetical protein GCM10028805_26990 [Spirosoma harenae]
MKKHTYQEVIIFTFIALASIALTRYCQQTSITKTHIHMKDGKTTVEELPGDYYGVIYKGPWWVPVLVVAGIVGASAYLIWRAGKK